MRRVDSAVASGAIATSAALLGNRLAVKKMPSLPAWTRPNHAGVPVTLAEGPIALLAMLAGLLVPGPAPGGSAALRGAVALAATGSGAVGAYDDLRGSGRAKGFRGHLAALRSGTVTSGTVKIAGVGLSAATASMVLGRGSGVGGVIRLADRSMDTALIAGTANFTNLCDLRPGRAAKVTLALAAGLVGVGAAPVLGAAAGCLPSDLRERSMLGDCGANALGAAVGTVAAAWLPRPAKLGVLLAVVALNLASERVSFTAIIDRTPALRWLDHLGRG
jgi:UDP-GlcNAc:undecaprenyl-phosphate/decaprenyl-phosphate GlcNAc-1-phosphate transferase